MTFAATGSANVIVQPAAATDAAGQAGGSLSSTRAEAKTVSASTGGPAFTTTAAVTFQPDVPATATSSLEVAPALVLADGVAVATITATVRDQFGNPVPGAPGARAATGAGNTLSQPAGPTDAAGVAQGALASTVAEAKTVSATTGATAVGTAQGVTFQPGPAASLVLTAQPAAGTAGVALSTLTVAANDAFGNATALPGPATVSLLVAPAGAALGGTTTVSGAASASFTDLLLVRAGAFQLRVTSGGLTVDGAAFSVAPAAPAALAFSSAPAAPVTAGAAFTAAVEVQDAFGNLTGSSAVVGLALAAPGTLSGTTSRAAVAGLAAFAGLSVDRAGDNALVATSPGLTSASAAITVVPGPAAALAFTVQPTDVAAGDLFAPPVEVALLDAFGNAAGDDGVAVAVELLGGTDGATLFGSPLGVTVGGAAAFADLAVDLAGAGYRLRATAAGLTDALSTPFAVTSGPADPAISDVAVAPTSAVAGETVSLTATVRDFFGNPVAGASVTFAATGSANTIVQPAASTDDLGRTSGELTSTRAEVKTVSGAIGAATIGGTATVSYLPDVPSAATSTLTASPTTVLADGTAVFLTATVRDQYANPVPGVQVLFAADGPATLTQPALDTSAAGVATGSVSSLTPGTRHVSALVGGSAVAGVDVVFESTDRDNDGIPNGEDFFPDDPTRFDAFTTVPLDPLVAGAFGAAVAINDADQVAGYGDDGAGGARALAWTTSGVAASAAIALQPIPGNASSAAYGIGPTGTVVGESEKGADTVAVVWLAGSALPAELSLAGVTPPAAALGIGGSFIAGEATVGGQRRGVLWTTAGADPVVLGTLGGPSSAAYAVSSTGLVVGEAETGTGQVRGALWIVVGGVPGAAAALAPLPGHVRSSALAVSANGVIAGESEAADGTVHGVRWVLDPALDPGPAGDLGVGSAAAANATRVAGALTASGRAVTWDLRNLALSEDLVPGATEPGRALGMNAANKVVGIVGSQGFVAVP
ncbi:MAG: Ig-like domain-containing protein [Anaeromyxobacteraceae bacterium]|nr:Ig-like domain-containing protein [Anaeromyxobacteraceae bacterium]